MEVTPGTASRPVLGKASPHPLAHPPQTRQQRLRWILLFVGMGLGLKFAPLGFFLYSAATVLGVLGVSRLLLTSHTPLQITRTLPQDRLEPGSRLPVQVTLTNVSRIPIPWLYWEDTLESGLKAEGPACGFAPFSGGETRELNYQLEFPSRGLYRIGPVVLEHNDPFGLQRRFQVGADAGFVTVLPRTLSLSLVFPPANRPVHEIPRRRSLFEDPSRYAGIRDHQPQDSLRRIHWRATARTGQLQSRMYEPAVHSGLMLVLELHPHVWQESLPPVPDGMSITPTQWQATLLHERLELAITAAASLADHVLGGGQGVGLFCNGADAAERYPEDWTGLRFRPDDAAPERAGQQVVTRRRPYEVPMGKGSWQRETLRTALARVIPCDGLTLPRLLVAELPRLPRGQVLALLVPSVTPELSSALEMLARAGFDLLVIWFGRGERPPGEGRLPSRVRLHRVSNEAELLALGARAL